MKVRDNKFELEDDDDFDFRFEASPNVNQNIQSIERTLIIHATEGQNVEGAVGTFLIKKKKDDSRSGLSIHLILGKDGRELVQMIPFLRGANHAAEYNTKSIGIELDYPGDVAESEVQGKRYVYASALNNPSFRSWPLYPKEQLDTLVRISKTLMDNYQIVDVAGHEELHSYKMDPGPAFPIVQFRERLGGVMGRSVVFQETANKVRVRNMPGPGFSFLDEPEIPANKRVTIINEYNDESGAAYCLISVIDTIEGNPWIVGWVQKKDVRVRENQKFIIREDHYLGTPEGGRFQVVEPHIRGFDQKHSIKEHKYIIMHFTTGTRIESTISHFRNENSEVSAHLLIARDGRVIQFLPFTAVSFHAGTSWWERDTDLNRYSIGIELDNAGILKETPEGWMRKGVPISEEDVLVTQHWRDFKPKGWHRFTKIQENVAEKIIKALMEHYGDTETIELLGHDDVNLATRLDPGPAFPMEEIRERVFGRKQPKMKIFTMSKNAVMFGNDNGNPPNDKQAKGNADLLPSGAEVHVVRDAGKWTLVNVIRTKSSELKKTSGWVPTRSLAATGGKKGGKPKKKNKDAETKDRRVIEGDQAYYRKGFGPPAPKLRLPVFKEDPRIRIEGMEGNWSLVVLLDFNGREGWVETKFITPNPNLEQ